MEFLTDLAIEISNLKDDPVGISENVEFGRYGIKRTDLEIKTPEAEKRLNKPIGKYITIENIVFRAATNEYVAKVLKKAVCDLIDFKNISTVLVVGIGNRGMVADALGVKTAEKIIVTRHFNEKMLSRIADKPIRTCILTPSVYGKTGITSFDIIKGTVEKIKPDCLIVVDSLMALKKERLCSTIQMTDGGICAGSGLNNINSPISKETMGIPVIAIGVPMMVNINALLNETKKSVKNESDDEKDGKSLKKTIKQKLKSYRIKNKFDELADNIKEIMEQAIGKEKNEKEDILKSIELLKSNVGNLVVTPKDIDNIVEDSSEIIALGINMAIFKDISYEDILFCMK